MGKRNAGRKKIILGEETSRLVWMPQVVGLAVKLDLRRPRDSNRTQLRFVFQ